MVRDGRWFWWVVAACTLVVATDAAGLGPFAPDDRSERVEVLGDTVERTPRPPATVPTTSAVSTSTTLSEADALATLGGLDQDTLDALEEIRGVDPADLVPPTTAR